MCDLPKLSAKQQNYVDARARGLDLISAYRSAYNTSASDKVCRNEAYKLEKHPKIKQWLDFVLQNKKEVFAENFKNSNYLADFLDAENISQSEYENLSDEEKRDFALAKAMEIYDAEHQGLENERLPQDSESTVLTGRVEYNEEEENQAPQKPLTDAQIDNLARELAEFDESGETIGAFLSVLENDTSTDDIEILKNAIQGILASADLINFINSKTQNKVYNQSAMYKSPLDNFNDFYNQVFEKETASKQNNSKVEKSYFEYKNNQVYLRIKHDAINHGDKKHRLSAEEWKNVLENILNIENAAISNKQYSNDNIALIKVATPNGKYGVSIQFANGTNQISTNFY